MQRMLGVVFACTFFSFVLAVAGCIIVVGCGDSAAAKYSRTVDLSAPMAAGSVLKVDSSNGSVTVRGEQTDACSIAATVKACASTQERAQELAEQTQVSLEPYGQGLRTAIQYPPKAQQESIGVSFDAVVPGQSFLDIDTSNGNVQLASLSGDININTSNGNVEGNRLSASVVDIHTSNGNVALTELQADNVKVRTSNGRIHAMLAAAQDSPAVDLSTSNGGITVQLPPDYSGKVDASTSNGKIKSGFALSTYDRHESDSLKGTIGTGRGTLTLRSSNGSIEIR